MPLFWPAARPLATDLPARRLLIGLGAMKCGTTWLSDYLAQHPDFYHSPIKEMNVFNRFWANPFVEDGIRFRLFRMEEIILDPAYPKSSKLHEKLQVLAELGKIGTVDDYLRYFASRIQRQRVFGEISPSYARLPADALRRMAAITADVRFVFLMRDPAARAASHVQHLRRRVRATESVDQIIATLTPDSPIWLRSDYGATLDALDAAGVTDRTKVLTYETLFRPETIRDLCDWLGLSYLAPDFDKKLNVAQSDPLTPAQKAEIRRRLQPIYGGLSQRFGADRPAAWQWAA